MERNDLWCHFSGAESRIQRLIDEGTIPREDLAREVYDLLARTLCRMLAAGGKATGETKALVTGGVASSPLFRSMLEERLRKSGSELQVLFGDAELSGDNAVGAALIGIQQLSTGKHEIHE